MVLLSGLIASDGTTEYLFSFGNALCSAAVLTVTLKLWIESNFITWIHFLVSGISVIAWVAVAFIFNIGLRDSLLGAFTKNLITINFWVYILIATTLCLVPPYFIIYLKRYFKPSVDTIIRERELVVRKRKLREFYSRRSEMSLEQMYGKSKDDLDLEDLESYNPEELGVRFPSSALLSQSQVPKTVELEPVPPSPSGMRGGPRRSLSRKSSFSSYSSPVTSGLLPSLSATLITTSSSASSSSISSATSSPTLASSTVLPPHIFSVGALHTGFDFSVTEESSTLRTRLRNRTNVARPDSGSSFSSDARLLPQHTEH
jgi:hypothetical protein